MGGNEKGGSFVLLIKQTFLDVIKPVSMSVAGHVLRDFKDGEIV